MKTTLTVMIALALGALAGCDRSSEQRMDKPSAASGGTQADSKPGSAASGGTAAPSGPQSTTPTTPANVGTPSNTERNAQPPVQGREDVREPEQRRDFQQKGDGAGPKPGG
jgi:hypothetical protein